jgi:hypothetical protein
VAPKSPSERKKKRLGGHWVVPHSPTLNDLVALHNLMLKKKKENGPSGHQVSNPKKKKKKRGGQEIIHHIPTLSNLIFSSLRRGEPGGRIILSIRVAYKK